MDITLDLKKEKLIQKKRRSKLQNFIMLVGPAGAGKSTYTEYLENWNAELVTVSSDKVRGIIFGDENIQAYPAKVFAECRKMCIEALKDGKDVVLDATNLKRKLRVAFLNDVKSSFGKPVFTKCVVIAATFECCCYQNTKRDRHVPEEVIRKQFNQFQMPLYSEGWDSIDVFPSSNVHYLQVAERCMGIKHDNPHHKYDIYDHCVKAASYIDSHPCDEDRDTELLYSTMLWHDIGKSYTKVFHDGKGNPTKEAHYFHHEAWSAMYSLCETSVGKAFRIQRAQLISLHMIKYQSEYEKFVQKWAPEYKDYLDRINEADKECA